MFCPALLPAMAVFLCLFCLPSPSSAFPMFRHIQSANASPKTGLPHHRRQHLMKIRANTEELATIAALEAGQEEQKQPLDSESQEMRINTGKWTWMEAHSVREEVYMFAFAYFGLIIVLMVCLLLLISCCYMYDCLGCYEPFWKQSKGNTIVPVGDGQMIVLGGGGEKQKSAAWSWRPKMMGQQQKQLRSERRWSML